MLQQVLEDAILEFEPEDTPDVETDASFDFEPEFPEEPETSSQPEPDVSLDFEPDTAMEFGAGTACAAPLPLLFSPVPASASRFRASFAALALTVLGTVAALALWSGSRGAQRGPFRPGADAASPSAPASEVGLLSVSTDLAEGLVFIDGVERGRPPISVAGLARGRHLVSVRSLTATSEQYVDLQGDAATLFVAGPAATSLLWGWVSVSSPAPTRVVEDGLVVGTNEVDQIRLPPGEHDLGFVAESLGLRETRQVTVTAGRATHVTIMSEEGAATITTERFPEIAVADRDEDDGRQPGPSSGQDALLAALRVR